MILIALANNFSCFDQALFFFSGCSIVVKAFNKSIIELLLKNQYDK